jgi:hypothetical protein
MGAKGNTGMGIIINQKNKDMTVQQKAWQELKEQIQLALKKQTMVLKQGKREQKVAGYYRDNGEVVVITSTITVKHKEKVQIGVNGLMKTYFDDYVYVGTDNGKHIFKIEI